MFSVILLFLVPFTLARSSLKPDDRMAHHFDRMSRSLLANLYIGRYAAVSRGPDTTVQRTSGYKIRGEDECELRFHIDDDTTGATGYGYNCLPEEIPDMGPGCLLVCDRDEDDDHNICMVVCPGSQPSLFKPFVSAANQIDQNFGSSLAKILRDRMAQHGGEYKIQSKSGEECELFIFIQDDSTCAIGGLFICPPENAPEIAPDCQRACQIDEEEGEEFNVCMIVCSGSQASKFTPAMARFSKVFY